MMAVVAWLGVSGSAWACSCSGPSVREAVKQASVVFRGTLQKVEFLDPLKSIGHPVVKTRQWPVPRRFLATLTVDAVWKGEPGREIVLHTRESGTDCVGFWSDVGVELVVFAHQGVVTAAEPGTMRIPEWTDRVAVGTKIISPAICSHSGEVKDSRETLSRLGKPKAWVKAQ